MPRSVINTLDAEAGTSRVIAHGVSPNEARVLVDSLQRKFQDLGSLRWEWNTGFLIVYLPADRGMLAKETIHNQFNEWEDRHAA
jgi:hypothetical protein